MSENISNGKLNIFIEENMVIVEGDKKALGLLAGLINEHINDTVSCGRQISPKGPGSKLFNKLSTHGIYIHRLPCDHKKQKV